VNRKRVGRVATTSERHHRSRRRASDRSSRESRSVERAVGRLASVQPREDNPRVHPPVGSKPAKGDEPHERRRTARGKNLAARPGCGAREQKGPERRVRETAGANDPSRTGRRESAPADVERVTASASIDGSTPTAFNKDVTNVDIFAKGQNRPFVGGDWRRRQRDAHVRHSDRHLPTPPRAQTRKGGRRRSVRTARGPAAKTPKRDRPDGWHPPDTKRAAAGMC